MHEGKHGIINELDDDLALFADEEADKGVKLTKKKGCIVLKKNNKFHSIIK